MYNSAPWDRTQSIKDKKHNGETPANIANRLKYFKPVKDLEQLYRIFSNTIHYNEVDWSLLKELHDAECKCGLPWNGDILSLL